MSAEPLGAGRTEGLKVFGTGGIYSLLLLQLTSLFFIIVIRHWKFKCPAKHFEGSTAIFLSFSLLVAVKSLGLPNLATLLFYPGTPTHAKLRGKVGKILS